MTKVDEIMELVFDYADQKKYGRTGAADSKPVRSAIESLNDARKSAQAEVGALKGVIAKSGLELQRAVLAEREACAKARDWQPIDTAPKDGTAVLVYPGTWSGRSASIAKWESDKYAKKPRPYWSRDDDLGRVTFSRERPPTHWKPLPLPPGKGLTS